MQSFAPLRMLLLISSYTHVSKLMQTFFAYSSQPSDCFCPNLGSLAIDFEKIQEELMRACRNIHIPNRHHFNPPINLVRKVTKVMRGTWKAMTLTSRAAQV